MLPLVEDPKSTGPSLGGIPKSYSAPPWVASEEKGKSNKGLSGMELNQSGMPSGLPPVHLHPTSVVQPGGTSKTPALVKDRLSPIRESFGGEVCLQSHLEQGRKPPVEKSHVCGFRFFLSYRWELAVPKPLLWNVFKKKKKKCWDKFDSQSFKKSLLIFCDTEWPQ